MAGGIYYGADGKIHSNPRPRHPLAPTRAERLAKAAAVLSEYGEDPPVLFTGLQDDEDGEGDMLGKGAVGGGNVAAPGSRGGQYYVDPRGHIRYGQRPMLRPRGARRREERERRKAAAAKQPVRNARPQGEVPKSEPAAESKPTATAKPTREMVGAAVKTFKAHYERLRHRMLKGITGKAKQGAFALALKVGHTYQRFEHYLKHRGLEAEEVILHAFIEMPHLVELAHVVAQHVEPFLKAADPDGERILAKAEQLGLFGATPPRKPVQRPGIRGGHFYVTPTNEIRYGDRPVPEMHAAPARPPAAPPLPPSAPPPAAPPAPPPAVGQVRFAVSDYAASALQIEELERTTIDEVEDEAELNASLAIARGLDVERNALTLPDDESLLFSVSSVLTEMANLNDDKAIANHQDSRAWHRHASSGLTGLSSKVARRAYELREQRLASTPPPAPSEPPAPSGPAEPPAGAPAGGGDNSDGPRFEPKRTDTRWVAEHLVGRLQDQVAGFNRRARRLKVPEMALEVGAERQLRRLAYHDEQMGTDMHRFYRWVPEGSRERDWNMTASTRLFAPVVLVGETPVLAGWRFVAAIEHDTDDPDAPPLVHVQDGETLPPEYRSRGPVCDHCQLERRRNDTFVVRHEDGRYKQIGRQCLKDFLGHKSAEALAAMAEFWADMEENLRGAEGGDDEMGGFGDHGPTTYDLRDYLAVVANLVRAEGFKSRARSMEGRDTASQADAFISDLRKKRDKRLVDVLDAVDWHDADEAIAWAQGLGREDGAPLDDFLYNVKTVADRGYVRVKQMGIAAAIIAAHQRAVGREVQRKHEAAVSEYVGKPGERVVLRDLTVEGVFTHEGMYGTTFIHRFRDPSGNVLVWFGSNRIRVPVDPDSERAVDTQLKPGYRNQSVSGGRYEVVTDAGEPAYDPTAPASPDEDAAVAALAAKHRPGETLTAEQHQNVLRQVRWEALHQQFANADAGDVVTIKATIKKHDVRNEVKQTVITRAAVMTPEELAADAAKAEKARVRAEKKAAKGGKLAKGGGIMGRLVRWAKATVPGLRYVTLHKAGPETEGETLRMVPDKYNAGTYDVHEEDREKARTAFSAKSDDGKGKKKKPGGADDPAQKQKRKVNLVSALMKEMLVDDRGTIAKSSTPRGGRRGYRVTPSGRVYRV